MDIADLAEEKLPPHYVIESSHLGQLGFRKLYSIDRPYVDHWSRDRLDADAFTDSLLVLLGWRMDGQTKLSEVNRASFTYDDREAFGDAFLAHQPTIAAGLERKSDESTPAFLARAVSLAAKVRRDPFKRLATDPHEGAVEKALRQSILSSDLMLQNQRAAEDLRSVIAEPRHARLPPFPRNPIKDTNRLLEAMGQEITRMSDLAEKSAAMQATLNDFASVAITEMKDGAALTERNANAALRVGIIGIVLAVISLFATLGTAVWQQDQNRRERLADATEARQAREADRGLSQEQLKALQRYTGAVEARLSQVERRPPAKEDPKTR